MSLRITQGRTVESAATLVEGMAEVICHRIFLESGDERLLLEWRGPWNWPVKVTRGFVDNLCKERGIETPEVLSSLGDLLGEVLPWKLKCLGAFGDFSGEDVFWFERLEPNEKAGVLITARYN